jgi:hypothetical protein
MKTEEQRIELERREKAEKQKELLASDYLKQNIEIESLIKQVMAGKNPTTSQKESTKTLMRFLFTIVANKQAS